MAKVKSISTHEVYETMCMYGSLIERAQKFSHIEAQPAELARLHREYERFAAEYDRRELIEIGG
jgi:hypothetical protein